VISVLLLEDEAQIRRLLKKMIEQEEDFQVLAEAETFAQGLAEFQRCRPDVVFVDVDLQGESGLDCAKVMVELDPRLKVVFATAHSEYMAGAFELYAFDYLIKPFDQARLRRTLGRIREALAPPSGPETAQSAEQLGGKLLLKGREQTFFVNKEDIILVERLEGSSCIVTKEGEFRTSLSLSQLEEKLDPALFFRSHKSYLVNLSKLRQVEPYGRWTLQLRFLDTERTALITSQNFEELRRRWGE